MLKDFPLLRGLPDAEADAIAGAARVRTYRRGETILRAGTTVQAIGAVLRGRVRIERVDWWGNRSILGTAAAGQIFAESYALCGAAMLVDAVCAADAEIAMLPMDALRRSLAVLERLLVAAARKNRALSERMFCTGPKTIRARVQTYLSGQAAAHGALEFEIPFDRQEMADYLNLDRSALSKELGRMRADGLIAFRKNRFRLMRTGNLDEKI